MQWMGWGVDGWFLSVGLISFFSCVRAGVGKGGGGLFPGYALTQRRERVLIMHKGTRDISFLHLNLLMNRWTR